MPSQLRFRSACYLMPSSIYLELHHRATPLHGHGPRFLVLVVPLALANKLSGCLTCRDSAQPSFSFFFFFTNTSNQSFSMQSNRD